MDSLLENFSHTGKRRQREIQHHEQHERQRKKRMKRGKKFAQEVFNRPLTTLERQHYLQLRDVVTTFKAAPIVNPFEVGDIRDSTLGCTGLKYVIEYLEVARQARKFMNSYLERLGWQRNPIDYDPVSASHSTTELKDSLHEWQRMIQKLHLCLMNSSRVNMCSPETEDDERSSTAT